MCIPLFAPIGLAIGASAASAAAVGTTAVAATVAGTALSATAAIEGGQASKSAANANANVQRQQAVQAETVGADQAAREVQQSKQLAARQAAIGAAGGLDTTTGTMSNVIQQTTEYGELDALRITNNAAMSAWGMNAQADITQFQGNQAQTAGYLNAGSSILGAAGKAAYGYAQL